MAPEDVIKKFGASLPPGRIVATAGEAGYQARMLPPGGVTAFSQIGPMTQGVKNPMGYMTSFPSDESSGSWS